MGRETRIDQMGRETRIDLQSQRIFITTYLYHNVPLSQRIFITTYLYHNIPLSQRTFELTLDTKLTFALSLSPYITYSTVVRSHLN